MYLIGTFWRATTRELYCIVWFEYLVACSLLFLLYNYSLIIWVTAQRVKEGHSMKILAYHELIMNSITRKLLRRRRWNVLIPITRWWQLFPSPSAHVLVFPKGSVKISDISVLMCPTHLVIPFINYLGKCLMLTCFLNSHFILSRISF